MKKTSIRRSPPMDHDPSTPPWRWRDVLLFLAFSHGWTWGFWGLAAAVGETVWDWPASLLFYVGGAGVFLGGWAMVYLVYGRQGLRELGVRIVDPRGIAARWWALLLLLFPVLTVTASLIAVVADVTPAPLDLQGAGARVLDPSAFVAFVAFILIIGPLPEEIGWRGYLLDRLQLRWNALAASLVLGMIWWSWHLPLFALPCYYDAFGRASPTPWDFLWAILPAAVLYTWVYNNTDRSVLAVIVLHFMHNFTGEFLGMDDPVRPIRLVLEWGVAMAAVAFWGPRALRKDGSIPRIPSPPPVRTAPPPSP
jgi:uncharacterized protein